jgi:hypothetical protein
MTSLRAPIITEALRGLTGVGSAQTGYFGMLGILAAALALWWPKQTLTGALDAGNGPDTLAAVLIALGAVLTYHGSRIGAEEVRFVEQQSLREWFVSTPLSAFRVVSEFALAQGLMVTHLIVLALPFVLCAAALAGGPWSAIAIIIGAIGLHTIAWMFVVSALYLFVGHHALVMFVAIRVLIVGVYFGSAAAVPELSAVLMVFDALEHPQNAGSSVGGFVLGWALIATVSWLVLWKGLARLKPSG